MKTIQPNNYEIHSSSIVDDGAIIGNGTKIWHFSHVCGGAKIGSHCSLGQNVFVGNDVIIGNNVKIQNNVSVYDAVTLENDVFCGPSMVFTNVYNPRSHVTRKHQYQKTIVRLGATIGANATIICGVEIGKYALIGAGAVINGNTPDYALMVGVPARHIGWVCQCGVILVKVKDIKDTNTHIVDCSSCNNKYNISVNNCVPA